jgi:voltage-gated potassium channel
MTKNKKNNSLGSFRKKLYVVIFEADTPAGKWFDVILIASILLSVIAVMLDSVSTIRNRYDNLLYAVEWFFTIVFTIEYFVRLYCFRKPLVYARSFFGTIDLLAILPTYVNLLLPGSKYLAAVRLFRILRVFRILKLARYVGESNMLLRALKASRRKITVFLFAIFTLVVIFGSLMYVLEGEKNGFTSIPRSVYWAVVTLTTVGYGDISPKTSFGQVLAAIIMIMGYAIIAIPTGIVTVEMTRSSSKKISTRVCQECGLEGHDYDAVYCKGCGSKL